MMLGYVVCILFGFVLGAVSGFKVSLRKKSDGMLMISDSDPDGTYLFTQLKAEPYELKKKTYVTLEVKVVKSTSQK